MGGCVVVLSGFWPELLLGCALPGLFMSVTPPVITRNIKKAPVAFMLLRQVSKV
jgi:hypothetical protein